MPCALMTSAVFSGASVLKIRIPFPDSMTVEVELNEFHDDYPRLQALTGEIRRQLKDEILVTPEVRLVPKGSIPVSEGKAVRVRDLRKTLI